VKRTEPKDVVASIQARLVNRSHELGVEHQLTLARFGVERLLYRLSQSEYASRFVVKGAALLLLWLGAAIRPTKDVDLLGLGDTSDDALRRVFVDPCGVTAPDDGLTFIPDSVDVEATREGQEYGGMRVTLTALPAETVDFPGLLELPRARVRVYRPETSIAEKTEAMVRLGLANSRMKDLFDIRALAAVHRFDGDTLRLSIRATFNRRKTVIPVAVPLGLTAEFGDDRQKQQQWNAFVRRIRGAAAVGLSEVVEALREFLWPVLQNADSESPWRATWEPGGPWKP
jgi:hypothetical protein